MPQSQAVWPEAPELARLVYEAKQGLPRALDTLLASLRPPLVAFFMPRVPPDVADDLAQLALVRIAGALPRIDPVRADAYVSTVARNLLRTAYRRRAREGRRRGDTDPDQHADSREPVDRQVEYEELARAVHGVIAAKLPLSLADVVRAILRGETPADVARRQGVCPATVRTRLMRARALMRHELRAYADLEPRRAASAQGRSLSRE